MAERLWRRRLAAPARVLAALAGTLPPAVLAAGCLARLLPLDSQLRFAIGFTVAIPLWILSLCLVFLARGAGQAWLWCAAATLTLGALAFGVPH